MEPDEVPVQMMRQSQGADTVRSATLATEDVSTRNLPTQEHQNGRDRNQREGPLPPDMLGRPGVQPRTTS